LALAQTEIVVLMLKRARPEVKVQVVPIDTLGDILPPDRRKEVDGKSAFTSEIEKQLVAGGVDAAVHSMKDLPNEIGEGLAIGATPVRGDARDALVTHSRMGFHDLPKGARLGTSSVRRRAQLLHLRDDIRVTELHGNVETRLKKIEELGLDGIILAVAGLVRLGLGNRASYTFGTEEMIPAVSQGVLAVETRADDASTLDVVASIDDRNTRHASECERAFSDRLGGDCYVPIGAYAEVDGQRLKVSGMVASLDGRRMAKASLTGNASAARNAGEKLATTLIESGGKRILEEIAA
jgi:hydroxymethylbilane synthase